MTKKLRCLSTLLACSLTMLLMQPSGGSCATSASPAQLLEEADACRSNLSESAEKKKYRHHWLRCIEGYEKVYSTFSGSDQAAWALYHAAGLYSGLYRYSGRSKDLDEAVRLYRRITLNFKEHRLSDDAHYLIGM